MRQTLLAAALILAATGLNGCHIDSDAHGDSEKVKIDTPFGGLQVRTNDANVLAGIGLPSYPGATPVKKEGKNGHSEEEATDVNMSFGRLRLKIEAASYRTSDAPQQVQDFYRKALSRYGEVIQCENKRPIGTPTHTSEGLTCNDESRGNVHISGDLPDHDPDSKIQFKAGSKKHQHVVAVSAEGSGTKFSLVSIDLPGGSPFRNDDSPDNEKKQ